MTIIDSKAAPHPPEATHRPTADPDLPPPDENTPLLQPSEEPRHPADTAAPSPVQRAVAFQEPISEDEAADQDHLVDDEDRQSGYATSGYMGHSTAPPSYHTIARTERNSLSDSDDETEDENPFFHGPYTDAWRERRRLRARKIKIRKCIRFSISTLLLLIVGFALGKLMLEGNSGPGVPYLPAPAPPAQDGRLAESPRWSVPHKLPFEKRPDPNMEVWFTTTEFILQPSKSFWFHGMGSHVKGEFLIVTVSPEQIPGGSSDDVAIFVKVDAVYSDRHLFDSITVAKMVEDSSTVSAAQGIGIYEAGGNRLNSDEINFSVTYFIKGRSSPTDPPAHIPDFSVVTDDMSLMTNTMPLYGVTFGSWTARSNSGPLTVKGIAATKSIGLRSENGAVTIKSAHAPVLETRSVNGRLSFGTLDITKSASLSCSNAAIDITELRTASAVVTSEHGRIDGNINVSSSLLLETKTGGISAIIHTAPPPPSSSSHANLTVRATSQSGTISLSYAGTSPPGVALDSSVHSEAGIVSVMHASSYQGRFSAEARTGPVELYPPTKPHPGRVWKLDRNDSIPGHSIVQGRTWWKHKARQSNEHRDHGNEGNVAGWSSSTISSSAGFVGLVFE